jgi:hypothetical protein
MHAACMRHAAAAQAARLQVCTCCMACKQGCWCGILMLLRLAACMLLYFSCMFLVQAWSHMHYLALC